MLKFIAAAALASIVSFGFGFVQGQSITKAELLKKRIVTMEEIRRLDNEVFSADSDTLCELLGGCGVSD